MTPDLFRTPLSFQTPEAWNDWYGRMQPHLGDLDPSIRRQCVERLCMAVFRAERARPEHAVIRMRWLLELLARTHARHADVLPSLLDELRHHGDESPFAEPLRAWLESFAAASPLEDGLQGVLRGTLILLGSCGTPWGHAAPRLISLLDDPSDYVRGCAAKMLGERCGPDTSPDTDALFALIGDREIARPGIAGPFWGALQFQDDPPSPTEWMLDILERRAGPEPAGMPFNGVDFYLHELCDRSTVAIARMLRAGHKALAVATATEIQGVVAGMQPVLLDLGDDPDLDLARGAWDHLARYYHCLHPKAAGSTTVRARPEWAAGVDAYFIRQGHGELFRDVWVAYPAASLDDAAAWTLIDRALPAALRGEPVAGPSRFGRSLQHDFSSGAIVILDGDPDRLLWSRIEIIGRGLQGRWDPVPTA